MSYIGNTVENQNYVPAIDYFNGDGSTVAFTLSRPVASVAAVQAVISNVPQNPGSAFTVSGSTITFTSAPPSGTANIYVYYTSPNTQIVQPGQGTVGTIQIADASVTAAKLASGAAISNVGAGGVAQSNLAAGVAGNGPAFIAYAGSSTSLSNSTWTKVLFDTEVSDTNNNFASSTFTPTVAGYYQINAMVTVLSATSAETAVAIYKNGSQYYVGADIVAPMYTISVSGLIYFNGTTDNIDIRFYIGTSGKSTQTGIQNTSVNGFLARAA